MIAVTQAQALAVVALWCLAVVAVLAVLGR